MSQEIEFRRRGSPIYRWDWMNRILALACLLLTGAVPASASPRPIYKTETNAMVEIPFHASRTYADPFNDVTLDVTFTDPKGERFRVPAFWAGGNLWKVRYASPVPGTHTYRSDYPDKGDAGLRTAAGKVEITPYMGDNPLYRHGPLQVAPDHRRLQYADGVPFFWLGDTWWMGLCHRLHWPDEFKTLAADRRNKGFNVIQIVARGPLCSFCRASRRNKGFNVIQIVAGLYPDMPPFDPRGANEAGFPWEPDFSRIRPEYFDAADQRMEYLVDQGFTPCIVGAWGYFLPLMGVEKAKQHWRYLVARYGALPVVWCVAGEANLPYYRARGFPYDDREQVKGWTEVMRYLRGMDPFHRLITIHPTGIGRLSARNATDDISLLDFDMLQTPHGQREAVPPTVRTVRASYADHPVMPVINGEASYEMLGDSLPTEWTRRMFWICMMNGAAGHTYGANGIWQCNRRGQPHGPSPTEGSPPTGYGVIPWDDAMKLPGSQEVGYGKKLFEQFPWQQFKPHPEWAAFAGGSPVSLQESRWIWYPEGNPAEDAPAAKRLFRRTFMLPEGKTVQQARLRIAVDDAFTLWLNGEQVGSGDDWRTPREFDDAGRLLRPGANVLAVEAENRPAPTKNPAGLIACLEVRFTDGTSLQVVSDSSWRCAREGAAGWDTGGFDDAGWASALELGRSGMSPWGSLDPAGQDDTQGPQSCGIERGVRLVYVPESQPVSVRELGAGAAWTASWFDPVTGVRTNLPPIRADAAGSATCQPPAGLDHDWVLILEGK